MKLFVGNLSKSVTAEELEQHFRHYRVRGYASIVRDMQTGEARGFGFFMVLDDEIDKASIIALNATWLQGRRLKVSEARSS